MNQFEASADDAGIAEDFFNPGRACFAGNVKILGFFL
jgi:hypothetical protein